MSVHLPIYTFLSVNDYQMYPGSPRGSGIQHDFIPGLHLIAGVNGLGKSTFILMLYCGFVGGAAIRNDDFGVPMPEVVMRRDIERFRRRVADGAKVSQCEVHFRIGDHEFIVRRSLYDLSLQGWLLNGVQQATEESLYVQSIVSAMNVGSFSDVLTILNLIVFMFESRDLLMWSPYAQRNALRALFMTPSEANSLAQRAQAVSTANSSYRNVLYILNRDRKILNKMKIDAAAASSLSAEYHTLQAAIDGHNEHVSSLKLRRMEIENEREENRKSYEVAKFNYDEILREVEALKLARVASAFPNSEKSSHYVIARLIGDRECLACGADGGALIERWSAVVADGNCLVCGAPQHDQEAVVPPVAVDTARLTRAEARLTSARQAMDSSHGEFRNVSAEFDRIQHEIDDIVQKRSELEKRVRQIAGVIPPSPPALEELEQQICKQSDLVEKLKINQSEAEFEFSKLFESFKVSIVAKADAIRRNFSRRISDFLVEEAEISLEYIRAPIGESGQAYDWPTFRLGMTSGTFGAPAPRRSRADVSMSQGEFIDLAFRLALVEVAAESGPATMVFDAPEASLDALFMRRAGAFLSQFTQDHRENRLIVTSNLTNADMIPALFGAYSPLQGDPEPRVIPRDERKARVVDLLELAAPTSAVSIVGDRYKDLLDKALFPPNGYGGAGL